ncbi:MAG TPA: DUF4124 domain-containing protein [Usitatibacteraceae bacterium]|jgi:Domain of unknown function (DUF4124)|nr:DUF4124 domain-containing protein [Usitatibacteraceae bacterium]
MKRILVLACALAASTAAFGQLYKWVDKDGKVTYSDQPPPAQQSKQLNLNTGVASPPTRSAIERDKEIEKGRVEAREKAKVASEKERKSEIDQQNCKAARAYLKTVESGVRVSTMDDKGEQVILDDEQIAAERVKAQKAVDEACKTS